MSQVTQSGLKSSQNIQAEKAIDQVEGFVLYPGVMGSRRGALSWGVTQSDLPFAKISPCLLCGDTVGRGQRD